MTIERDPVAAVTAASALWHEPERAEALLLQAMADWRDSEAVLIALHRFYFYRGELSTALALAERCIEHGARRIGIDPDWRQVVAADIDFGDFSLPRHRFYLFSLNAYGYLLARMGRMTDGEQALSAVLRLDPNDRIGSARLLGLMRDDGSVPAEFQSIAWWLARTCPKTRLLPATAKGEACVLAAAKSPTPDSPSSPPCSPSSREWQHPGWHQLRQGPWCRSSFSCLHRVVAHHFRSLVPSFLDARSHIRAESYA